MATKQTKQRLPQGNVNQLINLLYDELRRKITLYRKAAQTNETLALEKYMKAAAAKYGIDKLLVLKLHGRDITQTYTAKVKKDRARISAFYAEKAVCIQEYNVYVPAHRAAQVFQAVEAIRNLQIKLLTADSDQASALFEAVFTHIKGLK